VLTIKGKKITPKDTNIWYSKKENETIAKELMKN